MSAKEKAEEWLLNHADFINTDDAITLAALCSSVSVLISCWHLYRHLVQYTMPQIQQWIVRILLICPIYAVSSVVALKLGPDNGIYVEFVRDLYEAFVVYSLLNLIMEYCGGEVDCVYSIENEPPLVLPFPLNCFMKPKPRDAKLLRFCQRGVLQFVLVKPIMASCDVGTMAAGMYYDEVFQACEAVIYNISYCSALYALLCIYLATRTMLQKFRCIWKISAVKIVILTAYYQGLAVKLAPVSEKEAFLWKCLLLCVEMVFFSIMLACAFPVSEFMGGIPDRRVLANIKDLFAVNDIMEGLEHNFKPAYKDYALQRSQSEAPETNRIKTYFVGNVDTVAMEMTERYRGRSSRMAFNSLLRGTKPIRAGLRRPQKKDNTPSPFTRNKRSHRRCLDGSPAEDGDGDGTDDDSAANRDSGDNLLLRDDSEDEDGLAGAYIGDGGGNGGGAAGGPAAGGPAAGGPAAGTVAERGRLVREAETDSVDNPVHASSSPSSSTRVGVGVAVDTRMKVVAPPVVSSIPPPLVPMLAPPRAAEPYQSPMALLAGSRPTDDLNTPDPTLTPVPVPTTGEEAAAVAEGGSGGDGVDDDDDFDFGAFEAGATSAGALDFSAEWDEAEAEAEAEQELQFSPSAGASA